MTRTVTYTCDLCGQPKEMNELTGFQRSPALGIIGSRLSAADTHVCDKCRMDIVATLPSFPTEPEYCTCAESSGKTRNSDLQAWTCHDCKKPIKQRTYSDDPRELAELMIGIYVPCNGRESTLRNVAKILVEKGVRVLKEVAR